MRYPIPASIDTEHAMLHTELTAATRLPGAVGAAAREVAELLHPHFAREEHVALPPLALLRPLSEGEVTAEMAALVAVADELREELPAMIEEHRAIRAAVQRLAAAAREEGRPEQERFAERLRLHILTEEEVLYPAAVLAGEYLKAKVIIHHGFDTSTAHAGA